MDAGVIVLEPRERPSTTEDIAGDPIQGTTLSEKQYIEEYFQPGSLGDWRVVMRVDHNAQWLCVNWALYRLACIRADRENKDEIEEKAKEQFISLDSSPLESTEYTPEQMLERWAAKHNLESCDADDQDVIMIIWKSKTENPHLVGHIQVKYEEQWESKMSLEFRVITHERSAYEHYTGAGVRGGAAMEMCGYIKETLPKRKLRG